MKKKRISMHTEHFIYAALLPITVFSVNTFDIFQDNESNLTLKLFFPIAGILGSAGVYYLSQWFIKNNPPILFNNTTIYVNKTTILFKHVVSLKSTPTH